MSWFDKHKWSRQRVEREREALAVSVEELTARAQPTDDECEEEEVSLASMGATALIPPRLSLQSRPLPAVRAETTKHMSTAYELEQKTRMPSSPDASATLPGKRLGRSTKVRLQAVRPGQPREPITERVASVEPSEQRESTRDGLGTREGQAIVKRLETLAAPSPISPPSLFCGSGVIEVGQEDATIHNPRISARSVVTVMLAGNPGPVVVHYVSLQPGMGFTLHMSAPVVTATPFNYAVWLF